MLEQWTGKLCLGYPSWIAGFNPASPSSRPAVPSPLPHPPHPSTCTIGDPRATRRVATRRVDIDAEAETWSMSLRGWKKLRYIRILLWQVIDPLQSFGYRRAKMRTTKVVGEKIHYLFAPAFFLHFRSWFGNNLLSFVIRAHNRQLSIYYIILIDLFYTCIIKINLTFYMYEYHTRLQEAILWKWRFVDATAPW